jgi:hypothetical protein
VRRVRASAPVSRAARRVSRVAAHAARYARRLPRRTSACRSHVLGRGLDSLYAVTAVVGAGLAQEPGAGSVRQPVALEEHGRQMPDHAAEQDRAPLRQFGVRVEMREDPLVLVEDVEVPVADRAEDVSLAALAVVDADLVEGRDRPGGHQDGGRPGDVLVVAGREGEALPGDELPAVRLVPHDHEEFQQPRTVVEAERRRALLGELARLRVAYRLARPEGARVVVDQDVRVAGLLDAVGDGAQGVRGEAVVAVQEDQVVAGRVPHTGVAGPAEAHVLLEVDGPYAGVSGRELVDDRAAGIR